MKIPPLWLVTITSVLFLYYDIASGGPTSKRDMACCLQQWRRASQMAARCQQYAHTLTYEGHTGTMEPNQRYMIR